MGGVTEDLYLDVGEIECACRTKKSKLAFFRERVGLRQVVEFYCARNLEDFILARLAGES